MDIQFITPEQWYTLGFIWADGHLPKKYNRIQIDIVAEDGDNLTDIFNKLHIMNFSYRQQKGRRKQKNFRFSNKKIKDFLTKNNYKTKSKDAILVYQIPDDMKKYWFHGFLDGDGCIDDKLNHVSFSGPHDQDWSFLISFIPKHIKYKRSQVKSKTGKASIIRITNIKNTSEFLGLIYENSCLTGLSRKRDRYLNIKKKLISKRKYPKGIDFRHKKYRVYASINGKAIHIGLYTKLEEAIDARKKFILDNYPSSYYNYAIVD